MFLLSMVLSGGTLASSGIPSPGITALILAVTAVAGSASWLLLKGRNRPAVAGILYALGPWGAWIAVRGAAGTFVLDGSLPVVLLSAFCALRIMGSDLVRAAGATGTGDAIRIGAAAQFLAASCLGFLYTATFAGPYPLLALTALASFLIWEHEAGSQSNGPVFIGEYPFIYADAIVGALVLAFVTSGTLIPEP
jgi:hypothetical protein